MTDHGPVEPIGEKPVEGKVEGKAVEYTEEHTHKGRRHGGKVHRGDHSPPVPPNQKILQDHTAEPVSDHEHIYIVPDHIHRHVGLRRYLPLLAFVLFVGVTTWQVWRVEDISRKNDEVVYSATKQFIEQSEANCRARNEQLQQALESSLGRRQFLVDVGKTLGADGNTRTVKLIEDTLKNTPPPESITPANCDFPEPQPPK